MAMIDLGKLGFDLVLNKQGWNKSFADADKDVENHENKWKGFAGKMGGALKGAIVGGVVAIGAAVGAMAVEGVKSAVKLEDTMAKFRSSTGMTAEETDKVKDTIKDLYKVNEDSYEDIAKMAEALHNNMQMNAEDIKKYGQNYLDYAKVTKQSIEEAVGAIDDIGDAWGLTNEQVLPIMDKLKYSQEKYGLSIQDGQTALKGLAASFQGLGMDTNQAVGYLNLFASTGVDSSVSMTAFNYALKQVKNPEELQSAIKDLQNTENATERAKKAVELFGAKAGVQMANALKPGTESIEEIMQAMQGADGAVTTASKNFDGSLKVQLSLLKKQFQGLMTDLGDKLAPLLKKGVDWLQKNMPAIQKTLTTVFSVVGDVLGTVIKVVGDVFDTFKTMFTGTSKNADGFKKTIADIFNVVKNILSSAVEIIKAVLENIKIIWDKYGQDILAVIKPIWESIKIVIDVALKLIKDVIKFWTSLLKGDWEGAWGSIKQIFIDIWDGIKKLIPQLLEGVINAIKLYFKFFYDIGKSLFNSIWDGIKDIWNSIASWVTDKINWLGDKLAFWKKGKNDMASSKADGSHFNGLDYVPFDGYRAILHEGERVLTREENKALNNGGLGKNTTINFNGNYQFSDQNDIDYFMGKAAVLVARRA